MSLEKSIDKKYFEAIEIYKKFNDEIAERIDFKKIPISNYSDSVKNKFFNSLMQKETQFYKYVKEKCAEIDNPLQNSKQTFAKLRKAKLPYMPNFKYNSSYTAKENFILARNKSADIFYLMRVYLKGLEH